MQTISTGRRGPNASNADQSSTQGIKQKGHRKAHHAEHPSHKAGSVAPSSSADVATSEEGPGTNNTSTVEPSAPASGGEAGVKHVPGNGSNERSRGNYWRGQDNVGFGGGARRNGRDQVRSSNHTWNQRGFRMNNGPAVTLRTGSNNRNYTNRNMFNNNNMSEFGNPAGLIHAPVRL